MPVLSVNRTKKLLGRNRLPGPFVQKFMGDRTSGFYHCKVVANIERGLLKFGPKSFLENKLPVLQWATMLQNITNVEGRTEYKNIFGKYEVSEKTLAPILDGLSRKSADKVLCDAELFNAALSRPIDRALPFHNLTAAVFAHKVLRKELGNEDAVLAAQAILFHHEKHLELIPRSPVVLLLRDAVKLEDLGTWSLTESIKNNMEKHRWPFYNPALPLDLRVDMIENFTVPEKQAFENPDLTFDAFHFALKFLFLDTNPNTFALPKMVDPYLRKHHLFNDFLSVIINASEEHNKSTMMQIKNLDELRVTLLLSTINKAYKKNVDIITMGIKTIEDHMANNILRKIETSLQLTPYSESLLSMKIFVLQMLGREDECLAVQKQIFAVRGLLSHGKKPEKLN